MARGPHGSGLNEAPWPRGIAAPRSAEEAERLGAQIRGRCGRLRDGRIDLADACARARCDLRTATFGEGSHVGLLIPAPDDRFTILLDPARHKLAGPEMLLARAGRETIAHELAHTLFYARRPGERPRRARAPDAAEERWCDRFAQALLKEDER